MFPLFLRVSSYHIFSSTIIAALGIVVCLWISFKLDQELKLRVGKGRILLLHLYIILFGFFTARWLSITVQCFANISSSPLVPFMRHSMIDGGGMGALVVLVVLSLCWKISIIKLLDLLSIGGFLGVSILRIGCLMGGCCRGTQTEGLLALNYPYYTLESPTVLDLLMGKRWEEYLALFKEGSVTFHPYTIYYSLGCLLIFLVLYSNRKRINTIPGRIASIGFIMYGAMRILTELFRDNPPYIFGRINTTTILVVVAGFVFLSYSLIFNKLISLKKMS